MIFHHIFPTQNITTILDKKTYNMMVLIWLDVLLTYQAFNSIPINDKPSKDCLIILHLGDCIAQAK